MRTATICWWIAVGLSVIGAFMSLECQANMLVIWRNIFQKNGRSVCIAADRGEQLAQLHSIRLFLLDFSVPVVQRIEQGFPKGKTALLHQFARDISCAQIATFELV